MSSITKEQADTFLTQIELKLKSPFSSLELAKSLIQQKDQSPEEFLDSLAHVLHRTDKITQVRAVLGLLGFSSDGEKYEKLMNIAKHTQEKSAKYEEWVRVVGGIVENLLSDEADEDNEERNEAYELLDKTCTAIIDQVLDTIKQSESSTVARAKADADPILAPYRYAFVSPELREKILPKGGHGHFVVRENASDFLDIDSKIEATKLQESDPAHATAVVPGMKSTSTPASAPAEAKQTKASVDFPGFRAAKPPSKATPAQRAKLMASRKKSSMFLSAPKRPVAKTTSLHTRKTAQQLLGQRKSKRAGRMKMIDDDAANDLIKKYDEPSDKKVTATKKRKAVEVPPAPAAKKVAPADANAAVAAAVSAYQAKVSKTDTITAPPAPSKTTNGPPSATQDWRQLLAHKSNKLSSSDRLRIQQFFVDRVNPDPSQTLHKIKLHEERKSEDGKEIKETFYLELDYSSWKSKQTKKIKRY